ncbi:MAG: hypothetical protein RLZZ537_1388, partial [Pseudomonadota bacterium]
VVGQRHSLRFGLSLQDGNLGLDIRGLNISDKTPLEAGAKALLGVAQRRAGLDVARRVLRIASGLESQVMGDGQILDVLAVARQHGAMAMIHAENADCIEWLTKRLEAAGRTDLADIEKFESGIIQTYLPQPLSQAEVEALVAKAIADTGADGPQAMGKVIAALKPQLAGRADMGAVSGMVKAALSK